MEKVYMVYEEIGENSTVCGIFANKNIARQVAETEFSRHASNEHHPQWDGNILELPSANLKIHITEFKK